MLDEDQKWEAENDARSLRAADTESLAIPSLDQQALDAYQQDATSAGRLQPEDL